MSELMYPALFEPFNIGNVTIKNRICLAPMDPKRDPEDTPLCDNTIAYYEERAKGGAGLIVPGCLAQPINLEGGFAVSTEFKHPIVLHRQMKKLVDACHKHGAKVFFQTWLNFGRSAFPLGVNQLIAPDLCRNLWAPELYNRPLTTLEVEAIIKSNIDVARFCHSCGADGMVVVGPYGGYLSDQFGTAAWNHRTDKYGGSVEKRATAIVEMVSGIKKKCGNDWPVLVRMSTRHHIEGEHKGQIPGKEYIEYGRDIEESIELAQYYVKAGADGFFCANGCYDALYWQYPPMYMKEGLWLDDMEPLTKAVDVPVICPGRILMPDMANRAIEEGKVTAIGLGRALLADPYWPQKAFNNEADDIRPCIGCNNGCIGRVMNGESLMCAVNANLFHESEPEFVEAKTKKKIAIIGAGVGGMEAARILKKTGHEVAIYEKGTRTGGLFISAAAPSFKHGDARLLSWYDKQMKDLEIPINFNCNMSVEDIIALGADEVIVATGSSPKVPPIKEIELSHFVNATEVLLGNVEVGKNVIILGAGLIGCETAHMLSEDGVSHNVQLVDIARYIMCGGVGQPATANVEYMDRILSARDNVKMHLRTAAAEFTPTTLIVNSKDKGTYEIPYDTVVMAVGLKSENELYTLLTPSLGSHVHLVGDAAKVGTIMTAIQSATEVAKKIQ